jgi:hypothetical protein
MSVPMSNLGTKIINFKKQLEVDLNGKVCLKEVENLLEEMALYFENISQVEGVKIKGSEVTKKKFVLDSRQNLIKSKFFESMMSRGGSLTILNEKSQDSEFGNCKGNLEKNGIKGEMVESEVINQIINGATEFWEKLNKEQGGKGLEKIREVPEPKIVESRLYFKRKRVKREEEFAKEKENEQIESMLPKISSDAEISLKNLKKSEKKNLVKKQKFGSPLKPLEQSIPYPLQSKPIIPEENSQIFEKSQTNFFENSRQTIEFSSPTVVPYNSEKRLKHSPKRVKEFAIMNLNQFEESQGDSFHPSVLSEIENLFNCSTKKMPHYEDDLRESSVEIGVDGFGKNFSFSQKLEPGLVYFQESLVSCPAEMNELRKGSCFRKDYRSEKDGNSNKKGINYFKFTSTIK